MPSHRSLLENRHGFSTGNWRILRFAVHCCKLLRNECKISISAEFFASLNWATNGETSIDPNSLCEKFTPKVRNNCKSSVSFFFRVVSDNMFGLLIFTDHVLQVCSIEDITVKGNKCTAKYRRRQKYAARVLAVHSKSLMITFIQLFYHCMRGCGRLLKPQYR